jgi:GNAT superfamily N-acetyltransferase
MNGMASATSSFIVHPSSFHPVGYCIGNDQYFKRDDVGIIYQVNVAPGKQRSLIGAMLVKAMFDRAAYGCRLFCCWCAQDIEANRFWESLGFVPLAFRAGSRNKGPKGSSRVHIFWQRRIRPGRSGHAVLVSVSDERRRDSRGSIGLPDSAGDALE